MKQFAYRARALGGAVSHRSRKPPACL